MSTQMHTESAIRVLDDAEVDAVAGGPVWFVVAAIVAIPAVATTAYALGEVVGSALAHEEIANGA
ncbi:MAG: hypothetical protein ACFE0P_07930 [Oceanicaulis sp.]